MQATTTIHQEVTSVLNEWADSYAQRNIQRLLSLIAPDLNVVMYGTGADEKRIGLAEIRTQAERDWAQTEAARFIIHDPIIGSSGNVAWVAADMTMQLEVGGDEMAFPVRFTGVLEHRGDQWLAVQAHFSLPASEQEEGSSVPA